MWVKTFERVVDPRNSTKEMLGSYCTPRWCRFCHATAPMARFRKEAHVVPQAAGNRALLSWEECDSCNADGAKLETDLMAVLFGERLTAMIGAKDRPTVKMKIREGGAYVQATASARRIAIAPLPGDESVKLRRTAGGYDVHIKLPKYRPEHVAKALARMAYFVLPADSLGAYEHVRRWLRSEETWTTPWFSMSSIDGDTPPVAVLQVLVPEDSARSRFPALEIKFAYGRTVLSTQIPIATWETPAVRFNSSRAVVTAPPGFIDDGLRYGFTFHSDEIAALPAPSWSEVAEAAYYRFLKRNNADGDALGDWVEAEQALLWRQLGFEVD